MEGKTPVLVRVQHSLRLREDQHLALHGLVALNCLLADEMGRGKTIGLLVHLAGEKGVWTPHLIFVPTSAIRNWEFQWKQGCSSFQILSCDGSVKEQQGWTKVNALQACITSCQLLLQNARASLRKKWKDLILDGFQMATLANLPQLSFSQPHVFFSPAHR